MQLYLSTDGSAPHWDLIRTGMRSVSNTFVVPAQDLLGLDTDGRMNYPGRTDNNWSWRLEAGQLNQDIHTLIREMTLLYGRCNNPPDQAKPQAPKAPLY